MSFYHPHIVYDDSEADRTNSIIRYIGNRILKNNKNMLCCLSGQTGSGKSWAGVAIAEIYSKMFNIPFDPEVHIISSLKELLKLINGKDMDKKIQFGSVLVFDEPQIEANARNWQSETNDILNQIISTFRNQRLFVLFATPYLEFIDKQSRILFHAEFEVKGFDRTRYMTRLKPRFLEFNKFTQDFYKKRLIVKWKPPGKKVFVSRKLQMWNVPRASMSLLRVYERKKKEFSDALNKKLLIKIQDMEKKNEVKVKNISFADFAKIYKEVGDNYILLTERMPHLTPSTIERYALYYKRTVKTTSLTGEAEVPNPTLTPKSI